MEEITTTEETILREMSESTSDTYTIDEYLKGSVNVEVPKETFYKIMLDRDVEPGTACTDVEKAIRDLCVADLFVWLCYGASRLGSVSDTDNGWTHSNGGYTLSSEDKNLLLAKANAIYEENDEDTLGKKKVTIRSHGVMHADTFGYNQYRKRIMQ